PRLDLGPHGRALAEADGGGMGIDAAGQRDRLDRDVLEAGIVQLGLDARDVVIAERDPAVETWRVVREAGGHRVAEQRAHRIALQAVPDAEQEATARPEHAPSLA